ncbi:MAG: CoA transferase [Chloroflexi bacterium]|nr:CoA transferase [Chloroflexota bacterium]
MTSALAGIRVLDFSRVLAGPFCTMLLGDLGADIIKIENPDGGDETRAWGPPWAGAGDERLSAYFLSVNRNKRSLTLNLKHPQARQIARQLAARSHIVVENFKPGQMAQFGLGYADLRALNPALVYCSITGFGQYGPYSERPGYDFVIQAMSGLMAITGPAAGAPYKVGVAVSDVLTALFAQGAILAALRHAEHSGQGQQIDAALFDSQVAALVNIASNYLVSQQPPARYGNQHANIVPYQTFSAADGDFVLAVGNDRQYAQLCQWVQRPDLLSDARYATNPARVTHRDTLIPALQAIFATRTVDEWVSGLLALGIPAGPINDVPAALRSEHSVARGLVGSIELSSGVPFEYVNAPAQLGLTPAEVRLPPPQLGEHSAAVLREVLGLTEEEIAELRTQGAI